MVEKSREQFLEGRAVGTYQMSQKHAEIGSNSRGERVESTEHNKPGEKRQPERGQNSQPEVLTNLL